MVEVFVFVFLHVYKHVFILEKQMNQLKSSVQAAGDGSICICKTKIGRCLYLCIGGHIRKASVSPWQVYQLQSSVQAAGDGGIVTVFVFVFVFVHVCICVDKCIRIGKASVSFTE